jgi:polyhydroxyalkanoate synthase subunit PhaE
MADMSEPDYTKFFADLWTKSGTAITAAQQAMIKDLAGKMTMPAPMMMPWQAFQVADPNLQSAADAFQKLMLAWKELPSSVTSEGGKSADRITTELLQKIFDPREWLNATGYIDETVRRLSEGPKFADFGHIESKLVTLMGAWGELRTASIEQQTYVLGAWTKAATEFATKLNEAASKGTSLGSRSDIVAIWVEIANRHQLEMQAMPAYLENQLKLLRASSNLRLAQQELADLYGEVLGLPTRTEIDDLARMVSELRRELRAERRARKNEAVPNRRSSAKQKAVP